MKEGKDIKNVVHNILLSVIRSSLYSSENELVRRKRESGNEGRHNPSSDYQRYVCFCCMYCIFFVFVSSCQKINVFIYGINYISLFSLNKKECYPCYRYWNWYVHLIKDWLRIAKDRQGGQDRRRKNKELLERLKNNYNKKYMNWRLILFYSIYYRIFMTVILHQRTLFVSSFPSWLQVCFYHEQLCLSI